MSTTVQSKCPQREQSPEFAIVCDWLAANGIDEFIPEQPTFMVIDDRIVYRGYRFKNDERGYDTGLLEEAYLRLLEEDRSVPLVVPVTDQVRAAFEVLETREVTDQQSFLVEVTNGSTDPRKIEAYRQRLGLDERIRSTRMYSHDGPTRTCLAIVAADGALHFSIGDDEEQVPGQFVLAADRIDRLVDVLPNLKAWLKSERPAGR